MSESTVARQNWLRWCRPASRSTIYRPTSTDRRNVPPSRARDVDFSYFYGLIASIQRSPSSKLWQMLRRGPFEPDQNRLQLQFFCDKRPSREFRNAAVTSIKDGLRAAAILLTARSQRAML